MTDWMIDTLVWTAALIVLVLLVRRPVARWFGPQAAYALWALPLFRLILPPLTLPAWLAPAGPLTNENLVEPMTFATASPEGFAVGETMPSLLPVSLVEIALAAWLAGAMTFLFLRFHSYRRIRRDVLAEARDVGRVGKVRLIESPLTSAPLAFGVIDKVVAVPVGFLAAWDREARDLALAHELAHHEGHDLLINMAVQPLFALHWFNPLGHLGWLALRRDQEAACDARVISTCSARERATYAKVIASFAAGPNVALAAPMACPVLGDKSIIERLRSLKMNNHSKRQRWLGRGLLAGALVAMPLTATITYAEAPPPPAPASAPEDPTSPTPPQPPLPPTQPVAAEAPESESNVKREVHEETDENGNVRRVEKITIIRSGDKLSEAEIRELKAETRVASREAAQARAASQAEAEHARKEAKREMAEARSEIHLAFMDMKAADDEMTQIDFECDDDQSLEIKDQSDRKKVVICKTEIMANALSGLKAAREAIATDKEMSEDIRKQVLQELDQQIRRWKKSNS